MFLQKCTSLLAEGSVLLSIAEIAMEDRLLEQVNQCVVVQDVLDRRKLLQVPPVTLNFLRQRI